MAFLVSLFPAFSFGRIFKPLSTCNHDNLRIGKGSEWNYFCDPEWIRWRLCGNDRGIALWRSPVFSRSLQIKSSGMQRNSVLDLTIGLTIDFWKLFLKILCLKVKVSWAALPLTARGKFCVLLKSTFFPHFQASSWKGNDSHELDFWSYI